ncbi:LacI family DNA-binding transcriptional regulator [Metabacillus indicus]|uniref:LacI family DNA-binding transcriptional regulator n=1 Tax=Metabacillus indicus TaxID=246786 RepID=UPI003984147F
MKATKTTITMQDIADKLNVSKALVSKALSNKPGVNVKTKEKIRLIAMEMGYSFNSSKSFVPDSQTGNMAVLLPRKFYEDLEYWGILLQGIEYELQKYDFSMMISTIDAESADGLQLPICIENRKVDGALILGNIPLSIITGVQTYGMPIVLVDSINFSSHFDHVLTQNFYGSYEAANFVLEKGFKRVAFVGDESFSWSFSERLRGYKAAIAERTALPSKSVIESSVLTGIGGDYVNDEFEKKLLDVLKEGTQPCFVAANDPVALECIRIAERNGFSCPADFSIIGFDNISKAQWNDLTTVDVDKKGIAQKAVELMIGRLRETEGRTVQMMLSTEIIERKTVAFRKGQQ